MDPIRVTSDARALLRSRAAKTLALLIVVLVPLAWLLFRSFDQATNETMRLLYGLGAAAPLVGIVVAVLSFLGFLLRHRRTVLVMGEQVKLPQTGIDFAVSELGALQLFTRDGASYLAVLPSHVTERLTAATARSGAHSLGGYIVEFPQHPSLQTFEVADRVAEAFPQVSIEKIGSV